MAIFYTISTGVREWTKEEMMAYLDWSKAENDRIETQVLAEMGGNLQGSKRRDEGNIWRRIEKDVEE